MKSLIVLLKIKDTKETAWLTEIRKSFSSADVEWISVEEKDFIKTWNHILRERNDGLLFVTEQGDSFGADYVQGLLKCMEAPENVKLAFALGKKQFIQTGKPEADEKTCLQKNAALFPFTDRLSGVLFRLSCMKGYEIKDTLGYDSEADFLLRLLLTYKCGFSEAGVYTSAAPDDSKFHTFYGIYDKNWYFGNIEGFLLPLLREVKEKQGAVPLYLQYYSLYAIQCRLFANQDNRNRHVLSEPEIIRYRDAITSLLQYVDNAVIMNEHDYTAYSKNYPFNRMLLRLKYHAAYLPVEYIGERTLLSIVFEHELIYLSNKMRVNIQLMEYENGRLEIDASLPDAFSTDIVTYYFRLGNENYEINETAGYSLTKFFGVSAYKRITFHASVPVGKAAEKDLIFIMKYNDMEYVILPEFQSHTSRLAVFPEHSYWHFGNFIAMVSPEGIRLTPYAKKKERKLEHAVWRELLHPFQMYHFKFFLLRFAWYITRGYYKNKRIWLFYDKLYMGGDSAEYLFKYAKARKDHIQNYYLIDRRSPDYRRLRKEGYHPVRRGSVKHRLLFLNANMLLVTNSTVFAFNNLSLDNSRYIRGIPHFHVVCLQHGLSVQKIAVAQQRLRDNTRLYFCASKYEIENLSKPIYNYTGYDALKLTGIPRYDGLLNQDKKQILISPTWRMQSAMLVTKNEGIERDYNPNFKKTDYYKVYNSLINDKRLIEAARQYGYRIVYVLHPIVSPQLRDFERNEYTEIVASTGDVSYENLFCESSLMVTDYSGVQFDFAYMRKPVVYLHHKKLEAHYEEGTFHYDTMAFGEICDDNDSLIDLLCEYMKNGCEMKEIYRKRADDFFAFDDRNNCQRVYQVLKEYQHDRIDNGETE